MSMYLVVLVSTATKFKPLFKKKYAIINNGTVISATEPRVPSNEFIAPTKKRRPTMIFIDLIKTSISKYLFSKTFRSIPRQECPECSSLTVRVGRNHDIQVGME